MLINDAIILSASALESEVFILSNFLLVWRMRVQIMIT